MPSPASAQTISARQPLEPAPVRTPEPTREPSLDATPAPPSVAAVATPPSAPRVMAAVLPAPSRPPDTAAPATSAAPAAPVLAAATAVRVIEPPRPASPAAVRPSVAPGVWVQVGAYKSASTAGRVAALVKGEILVVATPAAGGGRGEPLLRVRVGPFADRAQAAARLREIRGLGYQPFLAAGD
jgi:hypothetical protein